MKKELALGVALALASFVAPAATREDLETSAVVSGTIMLAQDGSVQSVEIPDAAKYGQPIVQFVHDTAMKWRFVPVEVDGKPVAAKTFMQARVVLKKQANGNYSARIRSASFDGGPDATDDLANNGSVRKFPPKYPQMAATSGAQGTVYLALRVDRSGHVVDAVAQQVNLWSIGPDHKLALMRNALAESAVAAARHWSFTPPTTGRLVNDAFWVARMPVTYVLSSSSRRPSSPVWQSYVPGPYTPIPWVDKPDAGTADTLADGEVHTDGAGPKLLSALDRG